MIEKCHYIAGEVQTDRLGLVVVLKSDARTRPPQFFLTTKAVSFSVQQSRLYAHMHGNETKNYCKETAGPGWAPARQAACIRQAAFIRQLAGVHQASGRRDIIEMMLTYQPFQKPTGSTRGSLRSALAAMADQTFQMKYCDNNSPRFDGSVFAISCSQVVKHKGVDVQGVAFTDLRDGDDVVYKHTYKHGRTRLWNGTVALIADDTSHAQPESPVSSDADRVSVASAGSSNGNTTTASGHGRPRKRKPKEAGNPLPKKKTKIGE